jgi:hypothetical protein
VEVFCDHIYQKVLTLFQCVIIMGRDEYCPRVLRWTELVVHHLYPCRVRVYDTDVDIMG